MLFQTNQSHRFSNFFLIADSDIVLSISTVPAARPFGFRYPNTKLASVTVGLSPPDHNKPAQVKPQHFQVQS